MIVLRIRSVCLDQGALVRSALDRRADTGTTRRTGCAWRSRCITGRHHHPNLTLSSGMFPEGGVYAD